VAERVAAPAVRLLCLPYLGGSAAVFAGWRRWIDPGVEVLPVELPGHGIRVREPALRSIVAMADAIATGVSDELHGRYALFGYSMGGLVAFELARLIELNGLPPPAHLFVAAVRAPDVPRRERRVSDAPDDQVFESLRRYAGLPGALADQPELARVRLPSVRADLEAVEMYPLRRPVPLQVGITAIGGTDDETVTRAELEAWARHTSGACRTALVEGPHFFIHTDARALLREIARDLGPIVSG
jgi:medium-chain acyl-[acyl-carrier-protein] hydrolase